VAMQCVPDGGGRRRGRPRQTWQQAFQEDLQEMRVSWSGVHRVASDRSRWKSLVTNAPAGVGGSKSKSKTLGQPTNRMPWAANNKQIDKLQSTHRAVSLENGVRYKVKVVDHLEKDHDGGHE